MCKYSARDRDSVVATLYTVDWSEDFTSHFVGNAMHALNQNCKVKSLDMIFAQASSFKVL